MQEIFKEDKYAIISNGRGLVHHIHNETNSVTTTGQPFMVLGDTEEYVNDLFYSNWESKLKDPEDELSTRKVTTGTPYPVTWVVGHDSEPEAMVICNAVMSVSPFVKFKSVKHPDRDEWANPLQIKVMEEIPEGAVADGLANTLANVQDRIKTTEQMEANGWF